jgi:hypothetical protein
MPVRLPTARGVTKLTDTLVPSRARLAAQAQLDAVLEGTAFAAPRAEDAGLLPGTAGVTVLR